MGASRTDKSSPQSSPSDSSHHGRFLPGTKVADRYRIVSLVGKGGMGEVYRADDLKLGHPVALKFLPRELGQDQQRLDYFHNEVRLSRQVSHPNVCRVYDIGDVDGQHFLSMEYIDGEDLKGLLRRIGRLPQDKGVEIAQQLCAGLAAAHDKGVLHRDLKPANIMIDGRGHVRITDFGLAKLAAEGTDGEVSGTPAYMAPEQLSRGETTIQSDLYSLGLILYEVFTGKAVVQGASLEEIRREQSDDSISRPSQIVDDLDPSVERAILRCLEKEPHERPLSAHAVAAALPGGDPLAAALAAGETPSPEMVAAAGGSGGLPLPIGIVLFAGVFLLLAAIPIVADWRNDFQVKDIKIKPDVFERDAKELVRNLGYPDSNVTSVHGFQLDKDKEGLEFWYRQSPGPLVPTMPMLVQRPIRWRVTPDNPPPISPGMIGVRYDHTGKLLEFRAVPAASDAAHQEDDWKKILAGEVVDLNEKDLEDKAAVRPPPGTSIPVFADQVWMPGQFVVAARNGRLVCFRRTAPQVETDPLWPGLLLFVGIVLIFFAGFLALRHLRTGRADTRGALRCALYVFTIDVLLWAIAVHHDGSPARELALGVNYLIRSLAFALRVWLYYVAFEPLVRRFWPDMLISTSRLLCGRFRNPLVGRDLLVGTLCGTAMALAEVAVRYNWQLNLLADAILGGRFIWSQILNDHQAAFINSLWYLTMLLLARLLFRNNWLALAAFTILATSIGSYRFHPEHVEMMVVWNFVASAVGGVLFLRFGLLSVFSLLLAVSVLTTFPYALSGWYSHAGYCALGFVLLVAGYGFYTSTLAGRSLFGEAPADTKRELATR